MTDQSVTPAVPYVKPAERLNSLHMRVKAACHGVFLMQTGGSPGFSTVYEN
jgi:hypothetical protein